MQPEGHGHVREIAAAGAGAAGGALFAAGRPRHEPQQATAQGHPIEVLQAAPCACPTEGEICHIITICVYDAQMPRSSNPYPANGVLACAPASFAMHYC